MNKKCGKCKIIYPTTNFYKLKKSEDGFYYSCKTCADTDSRRSREKHRVKYLEKARLQMRKYLKTEKGLNGALKRRFAKYGLTVYEYNAMLKDQNGCCKICGTNRAILKRMLHVDHDHVSGKVRGLLCQSCNSGIGWFCDKPNLLSSAIEYLKGAQS